MNQCEVPGCEGKRYCRGYCTKHYQRVRTFGSTDDPPSAPIACIVDGCDNSTWARGLCGRHYQRWRKNGSTQATVLPAITASDLPDEQWRAVLGYEGLYEVSTQGRVKASAKTVLRKDGRTARFRERVLRPRLHRGQLVVNLSKHARERSFRVHVLVLNAFVGPAPAGLIGLHWDDNPNNNRLDNLRWGTYGENQADRFRNNEGYYRRLGNGFGKKLTEEQAREILAATRRGERSRDIAARYGVTRGMVDHIKRGTAWARLHRESA